MSEFKGRGFRGQIVLWGVRRFCRYAVAYRDLVAMILLAVFAFFPTFATAQNTTTFVSTIEQPRGGVAIVGNIYTASIAHAQQFTTGDEEDGYTLSEIVAKLEEVGGTSSPRVSIFRDSSSSPYTGPGSSLYVLTNPSSLANGSNTFTAPANATLAGATNYWVVFENTATGTAAGDRYGVGRTNTYSGAEDPGTASGWSIANLHYYHAGEADPHWGGHLTVLLLAIRGTTSRSTTSGSTTSTDATLDELEFEDGSGNTIELSPMFVSTTTSYTALVAHAVDEITIAPKVSETHATVAYLNGSDTEIDDANSVKDGQQVSLAVGANTIKVKVTADDKVTTETYTVVVTRAAGALVLNLNAIATDNMINIAEKAAGFSISGDTGSVGEASVTVTVGTTELTATSADTDPATWSVSVAPGATYITGTSVDVEVNATKTGFTAPAAITRTLTVDLTAPTAPAYTAPGSLKVGEAIAELNPTGGIGIDEYSATGLPSGLSLDTGTGAIGGTPDTANASTASATVTVSDTAGNTATVDIPFPAVAKGDQTLTGFSYSASSVTLVDTAPTVTAPSGAVTDVSYLAEPATVCTVDPPTGALTLVGAGECEITATAEGTADYNEATATFTVMVQAAGNLVLNVSAIAGDNIINIAEKAAGFDISGDTGTEIGVSVSVEIGSTTLTTTSADDAGTATWSVSIPSDATYISGASVDVTVSASKTGYSAPGDVERTLTIDLTAPSAPSYTAPALLQVGVTITPISPLGGSGIDEYGVTGLPSGLSLDDSTGVISGTPDTADASTADATVTVSDSAGNPATVDITFPAVGKGDQTLTGFGYSASSVTLVDTAPTVTAPSGAVTDVSYLAEPATVCTVDPPTGALTLVGAGECEIMATAEGTADYNEATATFTVTVQAAGNLVLNVGAIATDNIINIVEKEAGFDISGDTGTESGVSVSVEIGSTTLTTTSADDAGTATWTVSIPADATYISGASVDVTVSASKTGYSAPGDVERTLTIDLTAPSAPSYTAPALLQVGVTITPISPLGGSGIDEYGATGLPSGLSLDDSTGVISGTPDTADASTADATVTVSDSAGNPATVDITFPAVGKGDQTLTGFGYSASSVTLVDTAPTVTAPSGAVTDVSYLAEPATVCTVDPPTGALTLVGAGECEITATAEGTADYNEGTATYTVTVQTAGNLVLNVSAIAGDNTINIAEKAAGFAISGDTGSEGGVSVTVTVGTTDLTATSSSADPATWSVSVPSGATYISGASVDVTVSAGKTGFTAPSDVQRTLTIDLTAPTAPTYAAPASLQVGVAIPSMSPSGGADVDAYAVTGLPSGLVIDAGTGVISGTPDTADTNTTSATVTVSDTAGNPATVDITFPAVAKGDQTLGGFEYSASSVTFGSTAPTVTTPTGVQTTLSYLATPDTVCAVDSSTGELTFVGVGTCVVTATAASNSNYNQATATFSVTVQSAGALVELSVAPATVDEAGSATTVTVTVTGTLVGSARSTATAVSVSVGAPGDAATEGADYATVDDVTLTIEAEQTSGTVDVTLTPIDDDIVEGDETLTVAGTTGVEDLAVTATVFTIRDDERGVVVSPTSLTVSEGGSASYSVVLTSRPSGSVKVTISDPSGTDLQRSRGLIWFNRTNWSVAQTVTVTARQDDDAEDDTVTISHAVSGADYGVNGVTADSVSVTIDDDDKATGALVLNVNAIAGDNTVNIAEKASGFDITGDTGSQGGMSVTVTVGATELTATSAGADPATWSVSVPADASYITGASVDVEVNASKSGYAAPTAVERTLTVDLTAPAAPTYTAPAALTVGTAIRSMSPSGGSGIAEYAATGLLSGLTINTASGVISGTPDMADADTASATVTVSDQAGNTAAVSITFPAVAKGDQMLNGFNYSASSATFGDNVPTVTAPTGAQTTLSYSAAPSTVCTVNSSTGALTLVGAGSCEITVTAASTSNYNQATATYTVTVQAADMLVELSAAPATVDEAGSATTVTVTGTLVGGARSTATAVSVSVGAPGDAATEGADYATVNDVTLTIEAGQTRATVDVTLTPINDDIVEGDETLTVAGTTGVEDLAVTGAVVTIRDDERGVVVSPTSLSVSEGGSASYSVVLTSRPSGSVKVTLSDPSGTDLQRSRGLIWFNRTNWSVEQTVTVTARQDDDAEDDTVTLSHTVSGADYGVNGVTADPVIVTINDNDERGVTVLPTDLTLTEGASATYTVVLDTEPTENVTVTPSVSGSPDVTFVPPSLTFTPSDWDTAQTITVSATEDDDAYHDSSIVIHTAQGAEYGSLVDGPISVTISDNEVASQGELPAQVRDLSATATATHVDLTWIAVEDAVLGYRVEASYDGGANWAAVEDHTGSIDTTYRHDVGLRFSETRRYRVSALGENGAGLPSDYVRASATVATGGLTATVAVSENTTDPVPAVDLCWIPEGVAASELSDAAIAWNPVRSSGSADLSDLPWQSVGSGSSEVDCEGGMGVRVTSISENQRYAFRMRANHGGAWMVSNEAEALWVDSSKPLRTVVTAGASGLSGDTQVPALICRNFNDPATREDEQGSFFISVGFTTAPPEYLRYEPVSGFDPSSDLTLVNATAERVDRPYDTRLGYRVRITPSVWGEPVAVSLAGDVVTHEATSVGNQASGEFRRETADSVDCDTFAQEPARRSQVVAVGIEADGDRNGEWTTGEPIRVTLQFDEPVRVTTADGVPSVTLTIGEAAPAQSSNGEAAVEVTAPFSHVAHEDTVVFEHLVTADEGPIGDITLLADSLSLNGGEINSFSGPAVDLAHPEAAVTDEQIMPPDLTAAWSMVPGAHEGGESRFEIHLQFSEAVDLIEVIGEPNLLEHAFTVTAGSIEAIRPARDRRGEFLAGEWVLRVAPASEEPVTIAPVVDLACDQPGAICTIDDRLLTEAPTVTVHRTEQGLSVADAEVGEGPGAVLVFEVTLARAVDHPVTVDYKTADGTAKAGQDYAAASGTLRIEAGQTTGRVRVNIIDDSHDEGEETLTLVLANASNAQIHDGEALGIIVNSDPMPAAWLARFGRAASDHVAQAIARRLERGPREEHMTVGGLRLDRLFTSSAAPDAGRAATASTHLDPDPLASTAMRPSPGLWASAGSGSNNTQPVGGFDAQGAPGDMAAPNGRPSRGSETLPDLRNALLGSSFFYTFGGSEDASAGSVAAWGETASTRFKGSEGTLSLDGEVTTAVLGLDKRYGRWLVGSTLSFSEGEGGYRRPGVLGGSMESTLASLNPYAHYELNETTSLWGVLGYGRGNLRLTPQGAESALETALSNRMAAFGGRGLLQVRSGDAGRFELALRSDALLTRTHSEAVQGLAAAQVATSRVRLLLEGSGSVPVWSGMLSPSLEAGLRYDGGDAETGAGLEIGGGLGYTAGRVSVQVNARGLLAHQDTEYEEWGFSGSIAYIPSEDGRGLSMKLGLGLGATQSGVQSLWNLQDTSGLVRGTDFDAGQRLESEFSYGLEGLNGRGLWVPFVGARTSDGAQDYRMGLKLIAGANAEAQLEIGRREEAARPPDDAIRLLGKLRW